MDEHAPLPWWARKITESCNKSWRVEDANLETVADGLDAPTAAFIVDAAYHHDELVFFVKGDADGRCLAPEFIAKDDEFGNPHYTRLDCGKCRTCAARALLARIDEEKIP